LLSRRVTQALRFMAVLTGSGTNSTQSLTGRWRRSWISRQTCWHEMARSQLQIASSCGRTRAPGLRVAL